MCRAWSWPLRSHEPRRAAPKRLAPQPAGRRYSDEPRRAAPKRLAPQPSTYIGRFAPSPTGPLHAGSLVAALASWLDARAWNQGTGARWLVRIEDVDRQRCNPAAAQAILQQLQACSLLPDETPVVQSQRLALYQQALQRLICAGWVYPCGCSRREIEAELTRRGRPRARHGELVYPGTCRNGLHGKPALAWRMRTQAAGAGEWNDRRLGPQQQDVAAVVGDFVVRRADTQFAYQLAVVVDDGAQGITHVVRGEDLADNTARQVLLQTALGLPTPQYLHTPLVLSVEGEKLSKQTGAAAIDTTQPLATLQAAAAVLGLPAGSGSIGDALALWVTAWRRLYNPAL